MFDVRPRYTPGSPGLVDDPQAQRVIEEERTAHQHALEGVYGAEQQARATTLGLGPQPDKDGVLRGIVEVTMEHGDHWLVRDLMTETLYQRPFPTRTKPPRPCTRCMGAIERKRAKEE
jgi:hypothetical protein